METADVVIVGGGVIGLSIAWHLIDAAPGLRVTVLEQGRIGSRDGGQASPAAAGMLAPLAEAHAAGPMVGLGIVSLHRYPQFIEAIRDAAGADGDPSLQISGPGMLRVALTEEDADHLTKLHTWQRADGQPVELLTGDEARRLEPSLSPDVRTALFSPDEKQVDPRRLVPMLAAACRRRGVVIHEGESVAEVGQMAADCRIETLSGKRYTCGVLVLATGAWSRALGAQLCVNLPVFPVHGQILALAAPSDASWTPLRHTLYAKKAYLVPRPEGRIVVGATEEPGNGFVVCVRDEDVTKLRRAAVDLVPALACMPLDGPAWAGLRPGSPDGLPILGPLPGKENIHIATGHYRNGILLAPITGEVIAHEILHGTPHPLLAPEFHPERFFSK